jgi:xylan 1,4-beta-xylosidase
MICRAAFILACLFCATARAADIPVTITVDAASDIGAMKPIYRFFGADEPNYAIMTDGQKLLADIGNLGPAPAYFRAHNLLTTGDGTPAFKWGSTNAYTEDAQGRPVYDWTILDHIFDAYLSHGIRPYAQIGFMPKALSIHPDPYQHHWQPGQPYNQIYTGWCYPPTDYNKWRELVYQWVTHCVQRYGRAEVARWYWEVWNEPNGGYWHGTQAEFFKLHDYAVDGVRRALPEARVGGPDAAGSGGAWMRAFLQHCLTGTNFATGQIGTPTDFVSFHAKGSPTFIDGHVRMGIANQLRTMDQGFAIIASYPALRNKPIVIGESDPDGCAACTGPQLGYRNTTMYSSYTAATVGREQQLADRRGVNLEAACTWAFEFENQPIFAGFREMATTGGIPLPVFNVFRMLGKMSGQRVAVTSTGAVPLDDIIRSGVRGLPDISALAARDGNRLFILAWHYHDDDIPGPDAAVTLSLKNLPDVPTMRLQQFQIDQQHSNAFAAWEAMGSPRHPTPGQMADLEKASQLAAVDAPGTINVDHGVGTISLTLPRQAVTLLILDAGKK